MWTISDGIAKVPLKLSLRRTRHPGFFRDSLRDTFRDAFGDNLRDTVRETFRGTFRGTLEEGTR